MKKVLILAYDFPPYVSVGGLRPYAWYKYFKEYNVYPVLITRQWGNLHGNKLDYISPGVSTEIVYESAECGMIIRTPYKPNLANKLMLKYGESGYRFLRKSISAFYEIAQWIWYVGPKAQIFNAASEYLNKNKVDVIIATGDPFVLFKYASVLSKEFNTPWIADYRDLWTYDKSNSRNIIFRNFNKYLENKYTKNTYLITTVSDFFKIQIASFIKKKNIIVLPNGFDDEAICKITEGNKQEEVLRIAFTGTIKKWHPIENFISIVSDFISESKEAKLEVNFYGINIPDELKKIIGLKFPNIKQSVNIYSRIPNDKLLKELAKNNLMLLFNDYSIVGTKIYDYFAIKRKILLCYASDEEALKLKEKYFTVNEFEGISRHPQEDIIKETNSGIIVKDADHLKVVFKELYDEFRKNGVIQCNSVNTEQYSRKKQTEILADIINGIYHGSIPASKEPSNEFIKK